jgi:benzoyl-CoA reductase/2-hydroxyglutaryl-CoA dehydratase subunit BcrC/BadD/HgdB
VIALHRARGGRIAAVLPIHYPRALLRAYGFLPVEVWGPPNVHTSHAASHLQPYVCSLVTNALSFLLSGGLDVADLIVVPHACDSLQGLGTLLIDFIRPRQPVLPIYLPRGDRAVDHEYCAGELRAFRDRLAERTDQDLPEEALIQCIEREEAADRQLQELHRCRARLPWAQPEVMRLIRSREFLPAEAFTALAQGLLSQAADTPRPGVALVLSGILPEPRGILDAVEQSGAYVAADDLACCGRRLYAPGCSPDPFERMAHSLLSAPPDPTRGSPIQARLEHLLALAGSSGARGVVFHEVKFCEPELFDLPQLRVGLHAAGVPSVVLEADLNDPLASQALTRLEAFVEMIA